MRTAVTVCLGALLLAFTPSIASAQKRVHVNIGGGPTFIAGDLGDHFSTGWGPAVGVTFDFTKNLEFQFEYAYRHFDVKDDAPFFGATKFSANHQTHQLDFNFIYSLAPTGAAVRPYVLVGPGAYNRKVEITEYVGNGIICDPFWYVCGAYPITGVVGSRGGWDFGYDLGGGVGFSIGETAEFYIEMRYHHVGGPEFNPPAGVTGTGGNADGTYYPLTFGLRF